MPKHRKGPKERRQFAEQAADMEMGYYVDAQGHQWDARPFVIAEVLRKMGYGEFTVVGGHPPSWWPGTDAMRRMVALTVLLRQAQSRAGAGTHPWLDPLLATTVEEVLRRLYEEPEEVTMTELVNLTTKLARLQTEQRRAGTMGGNIAIPQGEGGIAIQRVTETILQLPPEEQERARRALDAFTKRVTDALPVEVAS